MCIKPDRKLDGFDHWKKSATLSGKTSLLTCLLNHPAAINDRIALLEDSEEVNIDAAENKVVKSTLGGTYAELVWGASRISVIFYGSSLYAILPWR